jgi:hypothetical protein
MLLDRTAAAFRVYADLACPLRITLFHRAQRGEAHGEFHTAAIGIRGTLVSSCMVSADECAMSLHLASGQPPTDLLARASASMAQDGRDERIWVRQGPGKIHGAAEGPLKELTFAAKDLYDVRPAAPL